ncbi:signal peptide peptidase SppA [Candidatus Woesearchaeota archaeon]|nr:signal peptide peptidase SppA [Candidatus Woesearchaeota archaeon]
MKKNNPLWSIIKVIIWLMVLSFFVSIFISLMIGNDFESIDGNVALISITGPIISKSDDSLFSSEVASADELTKLIRKANKDDDIKAIILEINSPGGSAVASDEIGRELKKVNKTTVAWIREIGTSGGYWIASASDHIIANRMSITGSIGVIASYLGFSGFIEEHNVTYERLVAGNLKDLGIPFRDMTSEERKLFQKNLDKIHDYFIEEVAENRGMKERAVKKLATGQFYLGIEAKELGLVDELGSRQEVLDYVSSEIGEEVDLVKYQRDTGLLGALSGIFSESSFFVGKGIGTAFIDDTSKVKSISITT